ncbi:monosaccharide ABC transporter ATP-binding protein, CUT2 family [Ferrimonas sediminum]|uniref:Monosaccharide ABC transporter ATP-binding protein, CUT2 family n=1 Tax=Ferrimonas sediminum TaxID=718193 RepID=A0A1G8JZA3_9GAMM|nr:ABC transporter ATP-binding protein [Ferrimonas sediminum]SDI36518.1 monosaccharide ABC transporter ATP-binding protein, CUT2 family [Ferrimonas sediminum]
MAALTLTGVTLERHGAPLWAPLDLRLAKGQALLVSGPTGCGKSTLLQILAGLQPVSRGEVRSQSRCGLVLQDPNLQLLRDQIGPEVALALETRGVPSEQMKSRVRQALDLVELDLPLTHPTRALSLGQKYRVLIAAQLVSQPDLLLLDEPWAQLDDQGFTQLLALLVRLKQRGITLVITEHHSDGYGNLIDRHCWLTPSGLGQPPQPDSLCGPMALSPPAAQSAPVLQLTNLVLTLGNRHRLRADSLAIHPGECVQLWGNNGCGKTTLLRALCGLSPAPDGQVLVLNRPPRLDNHGGQLALVCQEPARQLSATTVAEELRLSLRQLGLPESRCRQRADQQLAQLGLSTLSERSPLTLSYGQQHLVAIASQLCRKPKLLLLDDPFAGLDADSGRRLWQALSKRLQQGGAVLIASHRPLPLSHRQWHIEGGEIHGR